MIVFLLVVIVFLAALMQTLAGFGFALVVMPLLTLLLGLRVAAPLVAVLGLTLYTANLVRQWRAVDVGALLRMGVASALGVPAGVFVVSTVSEAIVKPLLGLLLLGYVVYRVAGREGTDAISRGWVVPAGFVAGCLGGAYNTPGPPVIVYGSLRRWPREKFRASLQAFFCFNAVLVVVSHLIAHNVTATTVANYGAAVPALLLGVALAARVDARVDRNRFRAIVTGMIFLLGMSLVGSVG